MTSFVTFLKDMVAQARALPPKCGWVHAAGTAKGSKKSCTAKRGRQRRERRLNKLQVIRESQHNPAGSKLLRRVAKTVTGHRVSYREAVDYHASFR